jgi:aspartate/methionine/tyrosine aminotransferase
MLYKHGIMVIPGSACGTPGYIRVTFGKPHPDAFAPAAQRLKAALTELVAVGPSSVNEWLESHPKSD